MRPQIRFCTSDDGTRLAYAIAGNGPPLVRSPHWFTHLEHDWTNPGMRPWVEDLSKRYTVLRFDSIDVVYGTMAGYDALGIPYMAHIAPTQRW